ncbi:MAG: glycosyltransferase family 2 protein [Clostridia bacterium]|nr:glycosyltransferase family 2 protein [Clostridia bacterium]
MRFSVVIPVYNKANTLGHALDSVLKQKERDFEIVVVDDGSTDSLGDAIAEYEGEPSLRVIHQENGGVSAARNTGIKNAKGDYICFLDADDLYFENHLSVLSSMIDRYPAQSYFATSHITVFPDHTERKSSHALKGFPNDFLCENLFELLNQRGDGIINTNCICIRRLLLLEENLFFQPGERIGEDTDMWFRIALNHPIVISQELTTSYRREYSTATAKTSNSFTWIFARRNIQEMDISPAIKKECFRLIDRYKMTCSRDLMRSHDRAKAIATLRSIKYKVPKYYCSLVLCCLPYRVSEWLIKHI